MSQKKNYSRSFIILQENEKGHGISQDKLPTGYAKIEIKNGKCKISFYVQNLKKAQKPYNMILVCNKKDTKKLIKLGELKLDEYGKAEVSKEFDENNISDSGVAIDKVIGAAISQLSEKEMSVVMSGFNASDIPDSWREYPVVPEDIEKPLKRKADEEKPKAEEREKEDTPKEEIKTDVAKAEEKPEKVALEQKEEKASGEKEEEKSSEEAKADKAEEEEPKLREANEEATNEENTEEENNKAEETEEEKTTDEKEDSNIFDEYEKSIEETKREIDNSLKNIELDDNGDLEEASKENDNYKNVYIPDKKEDFPIGRTGEFFKGLTNGLEDLGQVFPDVGYCRWYKVALDPEQSRYNEGNHDKYAFLYYPMMAYYSYIQKEGHYLIGYKYDKDGRMKYIVYGILGTRNRYDQPFDGRTGFVSWVPFVQGKESYEDKGCWLMFYDFRNATILVPQR